MLAHSELERRNMLIQKHLFNSFDFNSYNVIHLFMSIKDKNEVDTEPIINRLFTQTECTLAIPRVKGDLLEHFKYEKSEELLINKWGIPEPSGGIPIDITLIDVVFIPLITFDLNGHRIGYGKGFYDKFLRHCRPGILKIGLSLGPPLDAIPYADTFDIPMDYCVYPYGVLKF